MDQRRKIWTLFKAAPTPLPFSRALRAGLCALLLCLPIMSQAKPHPLLPGASASTPGTCAITTLSGWQWWGLAALLLQTAAIGVLLVDRRHRLSAEREAGRRLSELAQHNHAASLGELSAAIAHELNQPLGAMLTNAEAALLMLESEPPRIEEAREALRDIARDNGRASAVLRRIGALYRGADVEPSEIDLNALVQEVVRLTAQEAAHRRIDVVLDLNADIPTITGDEVQLRQVVLNLLRNAMDAIPDHAATRRVQLSTELENRHVRIAVSDSGAGIPDHARAHIFEPFYTTKDQGIGMGLAISRRIAEAHNGRLDVSHSRLGGAQLALELPISEAL